MRHYGTEELEGFIGHATIGFHCKGDDVELDEGGGEQLGVLVDLDLDSLGGGVTRCLGEVMEEGLVGGTDC